MGKLKDKLRNICVLYICIWAISPPLSYGSIYRFIVILAFLVFTIVSIKTIINDTKSRNILFLIMIYLFYTLIVSYCVDGLSLTVQRNIQTIVFLGFLYISLYYNKIGFQKLQSLFGVLLILYTIWNFFTIQALSSNRTISRVLSKKFDGAEDIAMQGVGGFGLVYSILPLIGIASYLLFFSLKEKKYKIVFFSFVISGISLIFNAGYSIALIILALSLFIIFVIKNNTRRVLGAFLGGLLIIVLFNIYEDIILKYLLSFFSNTSFELKIIDIQLSFKTGDTIGTLGNRTERYMRSINLFMNNPIWGTLSYMNIGKHSAILDKFAQYGIFIGTLFLYLLLYVPYEYIKKSPSIGLSIGVLITILLCTLFNNIPLSLGSVIFILYPISLTYIKNQD